MDPAAPIGAFGNSDATKDTMDSAKPLFGSSFWAKQISFGRPKLESEKIIADDPTPNGNVEVMRE